MATFAETPGDSCRKLFSIAVFNQLQMLKRAFLISPAMLNAQVLLDATDVVFTCYARNRS